MQLKNKHILIISPEAWGINFVSKHHYATVLAQRGNVVFFLNPPSAHSKVQSISENLVVIDYKPMVRGLNRLPAFLRNWLSKLQINKILHDLVQQPLDIVWSFDPFRFQRLQDFGAPIRIYHPVDIHQTPLEQDIAKNATLLLATSDLILARFKAISIPKHKINHGLANHFLDTTLAHPNSLSVNPNQINVGYVGNLNYPFMDTKTLLHIIQNNPLIQFYFIGPYQSSNLSGTEANETLSPFVQTLQSLANVHLLGAKPSKELPEYLAKFDLFLMSYAGDTNKAELANPHKLLEYLSTGKTVVCHYIDEYKDKKQLLAMANTNAELPDLFTKVVQHLQDYNTDSLQLQRRQYALENTYPKQVERIEQLLK